MDRDGAARERHVRAGLPCYVWTYMVPIEAFCLEVLSELQLAETMPTYIESHRSCCAPNDKQAPGA